MSVSEEAGQQAKERVKERMLNRVHALANERKRQVYWIGFLEGILASKRIEVLEKPALLAEAESFCRMVGDCDAQDLIEDLNAACHADSADLMMHLNDIISAKRNILLGLESYTEKDQYNEFLGFCAGIICDGLVTQSEAKEIQARFRRIPNLAANVIFEDLYYGIEVALSDNHLSKAESADVAEWIIELVGDGFAHTGKASAESEIEAFHPIRDATAVRIPRSAFVLTGPMKMGPRSFVTSQIECCGGTVKSNVSRKVNYVVVASNASPHWITTHFGSKILKARELIADGYPIGFLPESSLRAALQSFSV